MPEVACDSINETSVSDDLSNLCMSSSLSDMPFYNIENDHDFLACVNDLDDGFNRMLPIDELDVNVFAPFSFDETDTNSPMSDNDPDLQYFNKYHDGLTNCGYYNEDTFNVKRKQCVDSDNNFSLIHLNVRSAPKNLSEFELYLNQLDLRFNVIGLSETWFNDSTVNLYNLPGYSASHVYRKQKRGGGVSVFVSDNINYHCRRDLDVADENFEAVFVEFNKEDVRYDRNIIVGVVYRPPGADIEKFIELTSLLLDTIKKEKKYCYLMGDYNINLLNAECHRLTYDFL